MGTRKTNHKVRFVMTGTESELQEIDAQLQELIRQKQDDLVI